MALLMFLVGLWVFWVGNSTLFFGHGDARVLHDQFNEGVRSGAVFGVSSRDFRSGLGQWPYPTMLVFDPITVVSSLGGATNEMVFGGLNVLACFLAGYFICKAFEQTTLTACFAGIASSFVLFLPFPLRWTQVPLQGHYVFQILCFNLALFTFLKSLGRNTNRERRTLVIGTALSLLVGVNAWFLFSVVLIIAWLLVGIGALSSQVRLGVSKQAMNSWFLGLGILAVSVLRQWQIVAPTAGVMEREVAKGPLLDAVSRRPWMFDDTISIQIAGVNWFPLALAGSVIASVILSWLPNTRQLSIHVRAVLAGSVIGVALYSLMIYLGQLRGVEIGPSPAYLAMFFFPMWTASIAHALVLLGEVLTGNLRTARLRQRVTQRRATQLLFATPLLWASLWTLNNWSDLQSRTKAFPVTPTATTKYIFKHHSMLQAGTGLFVGRVLLLQGESTREDFMNGLLYPTPRVKALREELVSVGVPVLNAYSQLSSGRFARSMNYWFTDGTPYVRQWITANRLNISMAKLLGVRYLVTQESIPLEIGMKFLRYLDGNYIYEILNPNLGNYAPLHQIIEGTTSDVVRFMDQERFDPRNSVIVTDSLGPLFSPANVSFRASRGLIEVEVSTRERSLIVLPIEYSSCISVSRESDAAQLVRVNYLLLGVVVGSSSTVRLSDKRHIYELGTCA